MLGVKTILIFNNARYCYCDDNNYFAYDAYKDEFKEKNINKYYSKILIMYTFLSSLPNSVFHKLTSNTSWNNEINNIYIYILM